MKGRKNKMKGCQIEAESLKPEVLHRPDRNNKRNTNWRDAWGNKRAVSNSAVVAAQSVVDSSSVEGPA
jgi:hypothetical protein